ncbi:uncharacterized protein CIMG_06600 [Coccidioides immitis RS]|uniref:Mitochondrial fusion and transport protein ugo1 n=2 Tax=Coccidioides immitis TaxID=5501 RepID=J3K8H4_COCIM|nr:uncharacterized protein CIMG_06600 [Coccidioides immitis RS]EAS31121.3 hypothetical protein CIMG_06600 [Coccidioides immitis RS]KMP03729.1 hypothetical protein CIRG_03421 [Coccidioides immitis RMSCC 2394]TPX23972.1 mitochondrial fusion and transport protein ugo1 [Coccidioides immitis]
MTSPPEAPNPLRPYYVPPSIGLPAGQSVSKISPNGPPSAASGNITSFGSSAREIFSDFDYSDYLGESSPSVAESIKQLLESALWRYSRVLISQPFEVAKTILQVYVVQDEQEIRALDERRGQDRSYRESIYTDQSSYSSDDEDSYFAPAAPAASASASRTRRPPHRITDRGGYIPQSTKPGYMLKIKDPSALFDVLAQLWTTNGPTSIWKGSTSTFVYSLLLPTLNTFIRSLLSAIIGYPEDSFSTILESDILTSTSPGAALVLTCLSAALASIVLSPVDTARTYLILSPVGHGPGSLFRAIRQLPTPNYLIPPHLLPITILSSTLPTLLANSTPLFLKSYLSLDPVLNPSSWGLFTLMASGLELGVRIPLETVLRRAQIATFTSPVLRQQSITRTTVSASSSSQENVTSAIQTVVPTPDTYRGIVGTMWSIVYEEGTDGGAEAVAIERVLGRPPEPTTAGPAGRVPRRRRGQGIRGLYRSWRLEMWGIVGIWGSGFLGALLGPGDEEVLVESGAAMGLGPVGGRGSAGAF